MAKKDKVAIFVFIDAFGWEILKAHRFLEDILTTRAPLGTVLGYSSTCVPTILTGQLPREHGHMSFFCYDPERSPFRGCQWLDVLPRAVTCRGRVRALLSKALQRRYGYSGYFQIYNMPFGYLPLFDYSEKRDLYQPGGINSGAPTIFDKLRGEGVAFHLSDWRAGEQDNVEALASDLSAGTAQFAYLYFGALDALLHAGGTGSAAVAEKIAWYDRELRRLKELAERHYDSVRLYVFSDHGMTDTGELCDLKQAIDNLGLRFGTDYAAMYDSTMARFWFLKDPARSRITRALAAEPRGRILAERELRNYGCDFADRRYGELFFLMHPGVLICPSFMGETSLAGMHGFAPEHKDSLAMFASNVAPPVMPHRLDDLYALMAGEIPQPR